MSVLGFELLRPELWFGVLGAGLLLAVASWGIARRRRTLASAVPSARRTAFAPTAARGRGVLRAVLATLALVAVTFAAMGPVRGFTLREAVSRGIDLVVCVDTSRSMLAEDLRPSRIERARREVRGLLDALRGDRVALVAFSGDARDVAPLTHDTATLSGLLDVIDPIDNRVGGTDLAVALEHALTLFDGRTGSHEAIALVTDGEDLEGRALDVARAAKERGIRVFVVGVGTSGGGKIPLRLRDGSMGFLRGPDGEEVVSRLDGTTLQRLASETGGDYLSTESSAAPLVELYRQRISKLEGRSLTGGMERIPHDRFQWPLVVALVCMVAELGLRERRRTSR